MNNTKNVNHHHHRRGHSFNGFPNIHPFSNTNSSQGKPGKISFESAKLATSEIDDLLSSTEGGKHDYDWLLTPPETPHLPSSEGLHQPTLVPPRSSLGRPMSNTHTSRLSVSQKPENTHSHSKPARTGSVTRSPSRSSSILNTRPSSPITRSPSAARPSTPTSRQTATPRTLLPRSLPSSTNSSPSNDTNKTRTSQGSRPSTPRSSSSSSITANFHSPSAISRSPSRPSTPSRRHSLPSQLPSATRVARKPIVPPDFPLETPPNLRTTLPSDRPVSAGRSRPGSAVTLKPNSEMQTPVVTTMSRRQPSPISNRGRLSEYSSKSRGHANSGDASEVPARKSATDNNGLGRTISKKSLDMAIRHMDVVRNGNGSGTLRSLSSASLYPQSIRTSSTPNKTHHTRGLSVPSSMNINGSLQSRNHGNNTNRKNGREKGERQNHKLADLYESYPYDSLLLKEDLNNTNWLHSVDEKCDIFGNGFESLPEPFGLC